MTKLFCLGVLVAALAGCGAGEGASDPPGQTGPLVVWERGGGIAGIAERLEIDADGQVELTAGIDDKSRTFELTDAELERLRAELDEADLEAVEPPPENAICADCFSYEIVAGERSATWDTSVELPDSVATLSAHLGEIATQHYPRGIERIESMA